MSRPATESFVWTDQFETGLDTVDAQHRGLVELINGLAAAYADHGRVPDELDALFSKLAAYADEHFRDEEAMMQEVGVDPRHADAHRGVHQQFIADVTLLKAEVRPDDLRSFERLLSFLVHWLGYHILGSDMNLARQVRAIRAGATPADAYQREEVDRRRAMEPFVRALDRLFTILSERNQELEELNRTLESRVAARTAELRTANARLETLSQTDALTGLPNRRHAMQTLEALWAESTARGEPLAVIMIDADHFKRVNDTHGHDAGDEVLRALARELQDHFRTDDIVCRLGGDEFLVIGPRTSLDGALLVAEQTRATVAKLRVPVGDEEWPGSISVGVAVRTADMRDPDGLMKAADEGVYAAKAAGKNCVRTVQIG